MIATVVFVAVMIILAGVGVVLSRKFDPEKNKELIENPNHKFAGTPIPMKHVVKAYVAFFYVAFFGGLFLLTLV